MHFWAVCAISAHLNVIAKHPWSSIGKRMESREEDALQLCMYMYVP